jgi:hypothetical protein
VDGLGFSYAPPSKAVKTYLHTTVGVFVSKNDAFGGRANYIIECLVERT